MGGDDGAAHCHGFYDGVPKRLIGRGEECGNSVRVKDAELLWIDFARQNNPCWSRYLIDLTTKHRDVAAPYADTSSGEDDGGFPRPTVQPAGCMDQGDVILVSPKSGGIDEKRAIANAEVVEDQSVFWIYLIGKIGPVSDGSDTPFGNREGVTDLLSDAVGWADDLGGHSSACQGECSAQDPLGGRDLLRVAVV